MHSGQCKTGNATYSCATWRPTLRCRLSRKGGVKLRGVADTGRLRSRRTAQPAALSAGLASAHAGEVMRVPELVPGDREALESFGD